MNFASKPKTEVPSPNSLPLIGLLENAYKFAQDPVKYMHLVYSKHGSIVALEPKKPQYVFVFSPEYNRTVLSDSGNFLNIQADSLPIHLPENSSTRRLISNELLQMNGVQHKNHRKTLQPALHKKQVENYRDDIVSIVSQLLYTWKLNCARDLKKDMEKISFIVAIKTLLGLNYHDINDSTRILLENWLSSAFSLKTLMMSNVYPRLAYYNSNVLADKIEEKIKEIISARRNSGNMKEDALSFLINAHDNNTFDMTEEELIGQTLTLFVSAYATTASALTWTLFLLTQHPKIMEDLVDELYCKLKGEAPSNEQLKDLPFLDKVIKESLRLFPPILWFPRVSRDAFDMGLYNFPKGTVVFYSAPITHRLPELYIHPNRFQPTRWDSITRSPYEYLPFGSGPRMCLGSEFALLEMKIVLPMILQKFSIALMPNARIDRGGLLLSSPKMGLPVLARIQDRKFFKNIAVGNIWDFLDSPE